MGAQHVDGATRMDSTGVSMCEQLMSQVEELIDPIKNRNQQWHTVAFAKQAAEKYKDGAAQQLVVGAMATENKEALANLEGKLTEVQGFGATALVDGSGGGDEWLIVGDKRY
eukprot:Skav215102  [mRNA]  locus=scaffold899:161230:164078:- [translate_table: standard]